MSAEQMKQVIDRIDEINRQDPNIETDENGREWPKELLYSERMTDMLHRYVEDPDEVAEIAMRGQHIARWQSPRDAYPMNRQGYLQWRTHLYKFHANKVEELMKEAGYDEESIERVKKAVGKRGIKVNPDTQLLEDVTDLVFIEHYMLPFAERHPEYSEEKWIDIIQKTWKKMSERGQQFALSGQVRLPEPLVPLIQKALGA